MKVLTFPNVYFSTLGSFVVLDRLGYMSEHASAFNLIDQPVTFTPFPQEFVDNIYFVLYGVLLIPVIHLWRQFIKLYVASKVAASFAGLYPPSPRWEKFNENFWLALHYTIVVSLEVYVMKDLSIWPPMLTHESRIAISPPYAFQVQEQKTNDGIRMIYMLQFSFYFLELLTLVLQPKEKRRSDYLVFFFHHIYTVVLLGLSWITINYRVGLLVLLFHDVGDIFLPIGKCITYAETHIRLNFSIVAGRIIEAIGLGAFAMFVVTFIIPRLFFFAAMIRFCIYDGRWLMYGFPEDTTVDDVMNEVVIDSILSQELVRPHANAYIIFLLMVLVFLYPMHIFWTTLIVKMIMKLCVGSEYGTDVRSDDESEDDMKPKRGMA